MNFPLLIGHVINENLQYFLFWDTCHVARIHKVCSLDLYANYFDRFCYGAELMDINV